MSFPDRIERVVEMRSTPEVVWAAISTAEGLGSWFGETASIELRPGGPMRVSWTDGHRLDLRIEHVEEPRVFAFSWPMEGLSSNDSRRTYVEFTLEPTRTGTTLRVVESGFAQLPDDEHREAYDSHSEGWTRELGELVGYVDAG